jgi:hypothetical protein
MAAEEIGVGVLNQMQTPQSKRPALIVSQEFRLVRVRLSPFYDGL